MSKHGLRFVRVLATAAAMTAGLVGCEGEGLGEQSLPGEAVKPVAALLVPLPASLEVAAAAADLEGEVAPTQAVLTKDSKVLVATDFARSLRLPLDRLRQATGLPLPASELPGSSRGESRGSGTVRIEKDDDYSEEAYSLWTNADGVTIRAATEAGAFYALQTLLQLVPWEAREPRVDDDDGAISRGWHLPTLTIEDQPRFAYRGLHLDVGRHFFDVDFVKSMLDTMAHFKFNRFHWHLTEDQGWRIQIDAFPRLTEVGAWRDETQVADRMDPYEGDGQRYGGFYTKAEIREVVAYAAARHITVIPEIEMPGHATAAVAAYPEFGCTDTAPKVQTRWGIMEDIFCPKEATFAFLETVLDEVMELFPSEYIHIGADEVPKKQWQQSTQAQAVMRREGLANEDELQSYFIRRIEKHLNANGRRLIGWDEILEGGLAPNATVMTWRNDESAVTAAAMGHDVIRTPHQFTYFDFYQGDHDQEPLAMNWAQRDITLETVYSFEPVPEELDQEATRHILGAQANLWTEFIKTPEHAQYMQYPRALALAEVVWSPASNRDWAGFLQRLPRALSYLDHLGVNYRWPREHLGAAGSEQSD